MTPFSSWKPLFLSLALLAGGCRKGDDSAEAQTTKPGDDRRSAEVNGSPPRSSPDKELPDQLSKLSKQELLDMVQTAEADRYSPSNSSLFKLAIKELAKRDAGAALSFFEPSSIKPSDSGLVAIFPIIAESDPEALKNWLSSKLTLAPSSTVRTLTLRLALVCLSRRDAKAAFEFYKSQSWPGVRQSEMIAPIFLDFGRQSPDEAFAITQTFLKKFEADLSLLHIASGASEADPGKGLEIAKKISKDSVRGSALGHVMINWLAQDRNAAIAGLRGMDPQDIQALLQMDSSSNGPIMRDLGGSDPDLVLDLISKITPSKANEEIFLAAVSTAADPSKLTTYINSFPEGPLKESLIQKQYAVLSGNNLEAALNSAQSLNENGQMAAYRAIGSTVGLEDLFAISGKLPEEGLEVVWKTAIPKLANTDPFQAAQLLNDPRVKVSEADRSGTVAAVGTALSRADLAKAEEWYLGLSDADKVPAMRGLARDLASKDVVGLSEKLRKMPRDQAWAAGVNVLIESIRRSDPEMASEWQRTLEESGIK